MSKEPWVNPRRLTKTVDTVRLQRLLRALDAVEWGATNSVGEDVCPACGAERVTAYGAYTHNYGCLLDNARREWDGFPR